MNTLAPSRVRNAALLCALPPLLCAVLGCSATDASGTLQGLEVGVAKQPLSGSPPPACVFGAASVQIGNSAQIRSDVGSNSSVVVQAGSASTPTLVVGDITSAGSVDLNGGNSQVEGTVTANFNIIVQAGASATATVPYASPPVLQHTIRNKTVRTGSTDVWIEGAKCHGTVFSKALTQYRMVGVRPGCDLTLTAGEYSFNRLDVDADATLIIQGPVKINTLWDFRFADRARLLGVVNPYDLEIYSGWQASVGTDVQDFRGMVTARTTLTVGSRSTVTGCLQSNSVRLDPSSVHRHAGYIAPYKDVRPLMEVELSSTSFPLSATLQCPSTVRLQFAAGRHQGRDYSATFVELGHPSYIASSNNCIYSEIVDQIPLAICENRDHPCVHHPDQWDSLSLGGAGATSVPLDGLRVTNFETGTGTVGPAGAVGPYYNLVYTAGTTMHDGLFPGALHSYEQDPSGVLIDDTRNATPSSLSMGPTYYSLRDLIQWRRRRVTEWIVWNAYQRNFAPAFPNAAPEDADFDAMPRIVREGSRDHGQVGDYKLAGDGIYSGWLGACSGTQTFFESNYTEGYQADFVFPGGAPLHQFVCQFDPLTLRHYCRNGVGTWPNPPSGNPAAPASLHTWGNQIPVKTIANPAGRALAKAVFAPDGRLLQFDLVDTVGAPPGGNSWNTTGVAYEPKPGDFFWRFDRCWHGGGIRHAMVLAGEPYTDAATAAASTTWLNAPMLDGSSMIRLRDYDFTREANVGDLGGFPNHCTRAVQCDCNGDGTPEGYDCTPPNDGNIPDYAPDPETGVTYAAAITAAEAPLVPGSPAPPPATCICSGPRPLMCPVTSGPGQPRYEYYVGESRSARELFVYSQKHDTKPFDWSVISEGLITQPSFDATQPHDRPNMAELGFGRIDDDVHEDVVWRRPNGSVSVALSGTGYRQWWNTGLSAPYQSLDVQDFGHVEPFGPPLNAASDGRADLVALQESGGQILVMVALRTPVRPTGFSEWIVAHTFSSNGNDVNWWRQRVRFADFNGDGVTDILRAVNGAWQIDFRNGLPSWQGDFGDVSVYQFADLDYDGRTDIVTRDDSAGLAWRWTSLAGGWAPWETFNTSFGDCGISQVRFVNWDGDGAAAGTVRADFFCLSASGDWRVVLDHDPANVIEVHARSDSLANIAFGNFKTPGDQQNTDDLLDDVLYFGGSPVEHLF